jgi:hypothetical protein
VSANAEYAATVTWYGPFAAIEDTRSAFDPVSSATPDNSPYEGIYLILGPRRWLGLRRPAIQYIGEGRIVHGRLSDGSHPIHAIPDRSGIFVGRLSNVELLAARDAIQQNVIASESAERIDSMAQRVERAMRLAMKRRRRLVERALVFLLQPIVNQVFKDHPPAGPRTIVNRFASTQAKVALQKQVAMLACWKGVFGTDAMVWIAPRSGVIRIVRSHAYGVSARVRRWTRKRRKHLARYAPSIFATAHGPGLTGLERWRDVALPCSSPRQDGV